MGEWRIGNLDGKFIVSHNSGAKAALFSAESGKMSTSSAPTNGLWRRPEGEITNVEFGDSFIEFSSNWRLGDVDNTYISLSHKTGQVVMAFDKTGLELTGPLLQTRLTTWSRSLITKGIAVGDRFIQIGTSWRVGDTRNPDNLLTITYAPSSTVAVMSKQGMSPGQGLVIHNEVPLRPVESTDSSSVLHAIPKCSFCGVDWCNQSFAVESNNVEAAFSMGDTLSEEGCSHVNSRMMQVRNTASNAMYAVESRSGARLLLDTLAYV